MRTKADQGHAQDAPLGSNEPTPIGLPRSARWALCCAALAAVGIVLPSVIAAEPLVRSALLAVTAGAVAAGAWIALVGEALAAGRATIRAALLWSALAAVATVGVAVADGLDAAMLAVAAGAALLVACFGLLLAWSYACTRDAATASAISITLAGLACAAPIWLGPIAESCAARPAGVNALARGARRFRLFARNVVLRALGARRVALRVSVRLAPVRVVRAAARGCRDARAASEPIPPVLEELLR
jgi:hypothetical protein